MTDLSGLGLPALEWGEVFHVGIRVADLAAAQREMTQALGAGWTTPATIPMKGWAPGQGSVSYDLTISFSSRSRGCTGRKSGSNGGTPVEASSSAFREAMASFPRGATTATTSDSDGRW